MPDWLTVFSETDQMGTVGDLVIKLVAAFLCGCVIAGVFRVVRAGGRTQPTFPATLVLLTVLCAMLPLVIGQNIAWAFGLVGALSIVRFRTVVEHTYDITFVIFAVLVGMAVGAGQLTVALVGMTVTGTAAMIVRPWGQTDGWRERDASLSVRIGIGRDPDVSLGSVFDQLLCKAELVSGGTSKQGTSLDLTYRIQMNKETKPTDLINRLNLVEGVQSVELRQGQ